MLEVERFSTDMSRAVGRSGIYFRGRRNTTRTIDFYDFDSKVVSSVMEFKKIPIPACRFLPMASQYSTYRASRMRK